MTKTSLLQMPFPPNPDFGRGATRRQILLVNAPGRVDAALADPFHEMRCELEHDGTRVTDIRGETIRIPNSSCPGAVRVLRELIGLPLHSDGEAFFGDGRAKRHCTHLLDLAVLAIAQAARPERERRYEAVAPDELDAPVTIEVRRNGAPVHTWEARDGCITAPAALAGRPLRAGFAAWAPQHFGADDLEAATVLARTYMIAIGRRYLTDALEGRPISLNRVLAGACYSYAPERIAEGVYRSDNVRERPRLFDES